MYIEPSTKIYILRNVPLDNTYEHTIYFSDRYIQQKYFEGKIAYALDANSYQRVQRGVTRIGIDAESLYNCNYMMFQNTKFGNKWFYAFINSVEYRNNGASDVYFEIDVMQTWFMDYNFNKAYVAREHAVTDEIGDNILPEPVSLGEYVLNDYKSVDEWDNSSTSLTDYAIIIAFVSTQGKSEGKIYDKVYSGSTLYAFHADDSDKVDDFLDDHIQQNEAVIGMYMCPAYFIARGEFESGLVIESNSDALTIDTTLPKVDKMQDELDGYKPRNNKLYTYPYNFLHLDNGDGATLSLRYEYFFQNQPKFEIYGCMTQPVSIVIRPVGYKGSGTGLHDTLNTESLSINTYPLCSWNYDAYQAWIAQNSIPLAGQMTTKLGNYAINGILSGGAGFLTGIPNLLSTAESYMEQDYRASIAADISRGNFNNGSPNVAADKQTFFGGRCSITAQYAAMIDDFFDRFGYATNKIVTPNRAGRPHWNYVQTIGCTVEGSVPADDMKKICQIYDNGITFWKNGDEVGNYSLDNRIVR